MGRVAAEMVLARRAVVVRRVVDFMVRGWVGRWVDYICGFCMYSGMRRKRI